jgi:hypothetical protein
VPLFARGRARELAFEIMGTNLARLAGRGLGGALVLAIACAAPASRAGFGAPRVDVRDLSRAQASPADAPVQPPAERYARLDRARCEEELARRSVPFARVEDAPGVLAPVRLNGPLHGVTYRTGLATPQRSSTPWEILDCRLALSLDDFAMQLATHDVVEVVHFSIYRPPSPRWPADRVASRHPGALAIDTASFVKRDGQSLTVERDFHGHIGAPTCGPGASPRPPTPEAMELRRILCDAADAKLFNVALTPDYNWAHRNHFHLEVTAGVPWFLVH